MTHDAEASEMRYLDPEPAARPLVGTSQASAVDTGPRRVLFTWDVDESRRLNLCSDGHWYCLDEGDAEKLWSVACISEMMMAAEIERLRDLIREPAGHVSERDLRDAGVSG